MTIWAVSGIADQRTIATVSDIPTNWIVAYPLQIRWRDSDTSRFYRAAVSATGTAATATATTTQSATAKTAGPTATTVVGLAVALAAVILLGIVAILVYRRRHRRQPLVQGLHTGRAEAAGPGLAEMPDSSFDKVLLTTN